MLRFQVRPLLYFVSFFHPANNDFLAQRIEHRTNCNEVLTGLWIALILNGYATADTAQHITRNFPQQNSWNAYHEAYKLNAYVPRSKSPPQKKKLMFEYA